MSDDIKDWVNAHQRQKLYQEYNGHKLDHSRAAYRIREEFRVGHQILHVHAWHMHMIEHYLALQSLLWDDDLFAARTHRR